MPQQHTPKNRSLDGLSKRPSSNTRSRPFPGVGMTLPTYSVGQPTFRARTTPLPAKVKKRRFSRKKILIMLVVVVGLLGLWLGGKFIYNAARIFQGNIFSALTTTKLNGEDKGRVNILLAGNSSDDPGHQGANLTDSIMILSIDTKDNTAFMLSVPRDLWVNIPGYGHHKINEAYNDGEDGNFNQSGYPDGGMGMLEKVIETNMGIDINYYSLINYNAFRQAVDAVGGIDVTINSPDSRGLYDPNIARADGGPLRLTNGPHHLDGRTALNLARARGDSYYSYGFPASDFDRTEHQRQMLLALKSKMFSSGVIANPVKISSLMDALGSNVTTDLKLSEVRRLNDLGKKIGNSNIKSVSLNSADGKNLLSSYTSSRGESALIPAEGVDDFSAIQQFVKKLTSNSPIIKENASILLLNGTDTYGLAGKNSTVLRAKSLNVVSTGDANGVVATTQIINNVGTAKPATLALLTRTYGSNVVTTNPYKGTYDADFVIVLGNDQLTNSTNQ
jgi:polyisoprenyl-teichoic acid--peptidoglycan teichoic acid transferase